MMNWHEADLEPAQAAGLTLRVTRVREPGKAFVEYALLVALTAIIAMVVLNAVGAHVHDLFAVAADAL